MSYTFKCPGCGAELEADIAQDAMVVECPLCNTSFNGGAFLSPFELASVPETLAQQPAEEQPSSVEEPIQPAEVTDDSSNIASWVDEAEPAPQPVEQGGAESTKLMDGVPPEEAEAILESSTEQPPPQEAESVPEPETPELEPVPEEEAAPQKVTPQEDVILPRTAETEKPKPVHPAGAPPATAKGDEVFGDYILITKVGSSDVAVTYRARHIGTGKVVALKVLLGSSPWAEEEASRIVAHLRSLPLLELEHEHLAKVFEVGENEGIPYITTEFIEGRSLSKLREDGISISEILSIIDDLCDALSYAHSMGVLHGDLKPTNIIVDSYGSPKITDFGFFRSPETVKKAGISDEISAAKAGYEFPFYAAPEQVDGNENYIESDIYSIGAILYHFLTGRPPLSNENLTRLCLKIRDEAPRPVRLLNPEVSAPLQSVVLKCLAKRPEQRYHTFEALKSEIHRIMIGAPVKAEAAAAGRALGLIARVAALLLLVAGGVFAFRLAHRWAANRFAESLAAAQTPKEPETPALVEEALTIARSEGPAAAEKKLIAGLPELEKLESPVKEKCLPGVYYFLARMAEDRADIPGATSFYRKMLEVSPDHPMGLYGAGRMSYLIQDYMGARDRFSRLVAVSKDDPKAHLAYGLSLWGIGDVKAATEEMRAAVELDPADKQARRFLAQLNAGQ